MTREERANAAAHELFFQAQVGPGEGIADAAERIAAAMLSFADDEAAAMRERAAKVFAECVVQQSNRLGTHPRDYQSPGQWMEATRRAAIRALPTQEG